MKSRSLILLSVCFGICLLIYACRKEIDNIIHDRDSAPTAVMEGAKVWYYGHLDVKTPKGQKGNRKLTPIWNESWMVESSDKSILLVVPARERRVRNKDISIRRFFIFRTIGSTISNGTITEFIGRKYDVGGNLETLLKNYSEFSINGFSGSILQYDVNYRLVGSRTFSNGEKVNTHSTIVRKSRNQEFARTVKITTAFCVNPIPTMTGVPPDLGQDCIITFLHEWSEDPITGCLLFDSYTYISHTCAGGGEGSGSGSGDDPGTPPYGGEDGPGTPCAQAAKLTQNVGFRDKFSDIHLKTVFNYEAGYMWEADDSYTYVQGQPNELQIAFVPSGPLKGFIHSHFDDPTSLPGFSAADIAALYQLKTMGAMVDPLTFTYGVVSHYNTTYLIKIEDTVAFNDFGINEQLSNPDYLDSKFSSKIEEYNVVESNPFLAYEKALLKVLQGSGLVLFRGGNTSFTEWKQLTLDYTEHPMGQHLIRSTACETSNTPPNP